MIPELVATVATFAVTTLWLGPCDTVYLWSCLNCFGLNFELWVQKLAEWGPLARIEVSKEGLGLGCLGHWRGWHYCSLESSSHTWLPGQNFLTTTPLRVVGAMAPSVVPGPPFPPAGSGGTQAWLRCSGPALSPEFSFPSFNNEGELTGDSQGHRHIPRTQVAT